MGRVVFARNRMWAYAEVSGLAELVTEDFQAGRMLGSVRIVNPFS